MKTTHRNSADLLRLQQSQLTRNGSEDGFFGYVPGAYGKPQQPANRKERRALAAVKRKERKL